MKTTFLPTIMHSRFGSKIRASVFDSVKKPWIKMGVLVLLTLLAYHSVMQELYLAWLNNHYYYHGFLIPAISLYLVFKNRGKFRRVENNMYPYGVILSILGLLSFLTAKTSFNSLFIESLSMILFFIGGLLFLFGKEYMKVLMFPIVYLLFAVPIPDAVFNSLIGPLQLTAAKLGEFILQFLGVPVFREGIKLNLAPITIEVARSCSAMHSLIALSTLSIIVAYLWVDSFEKRAIVVASSIPLAILANGFRLVLIILLVLWKGQGVLDSFFHPLSGKLFFLAALFILVFEASILKRFSHLRIKDL